MALAGLDSGTCMTALHQLDSANRRFQEANRRNMAEAERRLRGRLAIVTGASSGIGRAIAVALSREGAQIFAVGRNQRGLAETLSAVRESSSGFGFEIDLGREENHQSLLERLEDAGKLDVLVHCAGIMRTSQMGGARLDDFDSQYAVNVRAPYLLTQQLQPFLIAAQGQIVFINSSVALSAKQADLGQYSATKHALKAIADCLREELNPRGVRVLSVYVGRTATPMQEARLREEGKPYRPELLLQPNDIASVVVNTLLLPSTAEVTDISIRPMSKS